MSTLAKPNEKKKNVQCRAENFSRKNIFRSSIHTSDYFDKKRRLFTNTENVSKDFICVNLTVEFPCVGSIRIMVSFNENKSTRLWNLAKHAEKISFVSTSRPINTQQEQYLNWATLDVGNKSSHQAFYFRFIENSHGNDMNGGECGKSSNFQFKRRLMHLECNWSKLNFWSLNCISWHKSKYSSSGFTRFSSSSYLVHVKRSFSHSILIYFRSKLNFH